MDYSRASVYPSKSSGGRMAPTLLVMHTTEGYGRTYLDRLFSGQIQRVDAKGKKQKISVHWCIYRDGSVVEYSPWRPGEAVKCIHAGASSWKGRSGCNAFSLGYEIEHVSGDAYPEVVVRTILELNAMVKAAYPDIDLATHAEIAPGRKTDPTAPWKTAVLPRVLAAWNASPEEEHDMTPEQYDALLAKIKHADDSAAQLTYDTRITNRLLIGDYAGAVEFSEKFYGRFNFPGSLPKGITAEELKAKMEPEGLALKAKV